MPAAKTTTKKSAKPAGKPARKTAHKVTIDDVWAIIAEIGKNHEELQKEHRKTEKALRELKDSHEETEKTLRESIRSTEKTLREAFGSTEKTLNKAIGGLSNTREALVESFMSARLPQKFKQFGFSFNWVTTVKRASGENNIYTEIDGLLEDGSRAMTVEVQTTLRNEDVDDHLLRMEKVRAYADIHGDKREFLGAIAATIVSQSSRAYALQKGFFVIEPAGEDVKITKPAVEKLW